MHLVFNITESSRSSMNLQQWTKTIAKKQWIFPDTTSVGLSAHLTNLLSSILSTDRTPPPHTLFNGFHFLYGNQRNIELGNDGYDNYQAPFINNVPFERRMWVKGSIEFHQDIASDAPITCKETIDSARSLQKMVFVNINREFSLDSLLINEKRTMIYTNDPYVEKPRQPSLVRPEISKDVNLTPTQLLQYSMLTYNLHKIHYDVNYCRKVEQLPNIIVHGPMMVTLLLYWYSSMYNTKIKLFDYKNIEPCFVNENLTLCCAERKDGYALLIVNIGLGKKYIEGIVTI